MQQVVFQRAKACYRVKDTYLIVDKTATGWKVMPCSYATPQTVEWFWQTNLEHAVFPTLTALKNALLATAGSPPSLATPSIIPMIIDGLPYHLERYGELYKYYPQPDRRVVYSLKKDSGYHVQRHLDESGIINQYPGTTIAVGIYPTLRAALTYIVNQ